MSEQLVPCPHCRAPSSALGTRIICRTCGTVAMERGAGFARLPADKRRELAAKGARANQHRHRWTPETAAAAGRKSAAARAAKRAAANGGKAAA